MWAWLRTNLAVVMLCSNLVSGAIGALITVTTFVSDTKHLIADRGKILTDHDHQLEALHKDMVDVDKRLNDAHAYSQELRRVRDIQVATLEQRIAVLEAQLRFLADRTPSPPILGSRR